METIGRRRKEFGLCKRNEGDVGKILLEGDDGRVGDEIPTEESGETSRRRVQKFFVFRLNVAEDEKGLGGIVLGEAEGGSEIGEAFGSEMRIEGAEFRVGIEADFLLDATSGENLDVELGTFLVGSGENLQGLIGRSYGHWDYFLSFLTLYIYYNLIFYFCREGFLDFG